MRYDIKQCWTDAVPNALGKWSRKSTSLPPSGNGAIIF